ncbi:MAG TPA: PilC/PilY family type IV pilus protein [Methylophilaceae bacterium]|nr:PilC/PilY family type IV pilus protein [Methylophilaceae bacterium]
MDIHHNKEAMTLMNRTVGFLLFIVSIPVMAALTDLADVPLSTESGSSVRPNMMFILDNSGSMNFNYMPDYIGYTGSDNKCRDSASAMRECYGTRDDGAALTAGGDPPVYSHLFNTIYYNPNIVYTPPVNPCNTAQTLPSMTDPTSVRVKGHELNSSCNQISSTVDIKNAFPERVYCKDSSNSVTGSNCKRNGIDASNTFTGDYDYPDNTYDYPKTRDSNPHYFIITPLEHCADSNLKNCDALTSPTSSKPVPAYVRFCDSASAALSAPGSNAANGTNNSECQAKYYSGTGTDYEYARYGKFTRVDIVPSNNSYPKSAARTDCAGVTCTYAEEVTNFGNWYAYYRTRMQNMKSSAGHAFSSIDDAYRVGFITINPGSPVTSANYLAIDDFTSTQKVDWYKKLYAIDPSGGTPLREALSRVGRHYGHVTSGINSGMSEDPVEYECQQNFALLTTDGYWNGNAGDKLDGTAVGNQDNVNSGYSTRSIGAYDGNVTGASDTLADVAMYYYKTDLRSDFVNKVPTTDKDQAEHQHMVTFTLGLGLDGQLNYRSDYETATTGDFASIKAGSLNWPKPVADTETALDDLWHAAVNGRGVYFSAEDPLSLAAGVKGALGNVTVKVGAAAASATSSPNITPSDNFIYSSTYRTVYWDGEVVAKTIDTQTGEVEDTPVWSAQAQLDAQGSGRIIYKMNMPAASSPAKETFIWANLDSTEQAYFTNKCALLSQCSLLDAATQAIANNGQNLLAFLRGDATHENQGDIPTADKAFRNREHLLGDTVNATPAFVKAPIYSFTDDGYNTFKSDNTNRQGMLYIAANDGMLHALNAATGAESWSYIPNIVMKDLYKLADKNYGAKHRFFVDGSPQVMDIKDGGSWKTILVGGLNGGGRGYYALDVTNPASPQVLWEFCYDSTYCNVSDQDLGFTYGNPVIAKLPTGNANAGKWVVMVASGYNNVSPGNGQGYLYILDAKTGAILQKVNTGAGDTTSPSGLAKISSYADNANLDASAKYVYGGDLEGNLWRFNLTTSSTSVGKLATLSRSGVAQPITTRPEIGFVKNISDPIVFAGTGSYLGNDDLANSNVQSLYAIRDTGSTVSNVRSLTPRTISQNGVTATVSGDPVDWANGGWYVDFPESKERVTIDPKLTLRTLTVATTTPVGSTCSPGGTSWVYQFYIDTGLNVGSSALGQKNTAGVIVGIVIFRLPNGQLKAVATTSDGTQDTFGVNISGDAVGARRTGWRELTQ